MATLYQIADAEIRICIREYLSLAADTKGFTAVVRQVIDTPRKAVILLAGINAPLHDCAPETVVREWERRRAISIDLEAGITAGVYRNIRNAGARYLKEVKDGTDGFRNWSPDFIRDHTHTLPLLQHIAGVFSKSALKRQVGSISDKYISRPAAVRLAAMLSERVSPGEVREREILQRLEPTLEGIVRDLVGRVMLETIVESALKEVRIPYKREDQYTELSGVVYNHRADFVIPDETSPKAFIEVRKSSSRHASLYAKDKMFSAINWKGRHSGLLAVLIVDGAWTSETLRIMAGVFDYVIPIHHVSELALTVRQYLEGDETMLKWLIDFRITEV
ncbi:MAG: hypothetical protein OYK82_12315 [Gammaproteobacteria bacterium]|nr:hypothetical protein [Gammaproteobacteria bacterium]